MLFFGKYDYVNERWKHGKKIKHIKVNFLILLHCYPTTRLEMFDGLRVLGMFDSHINTAVIAAIYCSGDNSSSKPPLLAIIINIPNEWTLNLKLCIVSLFRLWITSWLNSASDYTVSYKLCWILEEHVWLGELILLTANGIYEKMQGDCFGCGCLSVTVKYRSHISQVILWDCKVA